MPQFDLANFIPQLAWLTLFFAILYFGIVRTTLPKVANVVTARESMVAQDIAAAEAAKASADGLRASYDADVAKAHADAQVATAAAKMRSAATTQEALARADAEIEVRLGASEIELGKARDRALTEIDRIAADAAADIVHRITGQRPDPGAALTAVVATR